MKNMCVAVLTLIGCTPAHSPPYYWLITRIVWAVVVKTVSMCALSVGLMAEIFINKHVQGPFMYS